MKRVWLLLLFLVLSILAFQNLGFCGEAKKETSEKPKKKTIYDFVVKDMNGKDLKLSDYRGKVIMIVNLPSGCGCGDKPTIRSLQTLYKENKDRGFVIIGFPADNQGEETDKTNPEIKELIENNHVTFPLTMKISVYDPDIHPLFRFLTDNKTNRPFGGKITGSFNQFIFDRTGKIVGRFEVGDLGVTPTIENALLADNKKPGK